MLIAIAKPPPGEYEALPIGIAGRGFDGNLTSDSTRLDGYVLSTDVAPTVLSRFGLPVPAAMSGQAIRSDPPLDAAAVVSLGERLAAIPTRRGPVIGFALLAWVVVFALAAAASRGGLASRGARVLALSIVYLPLVLLVGAALEAGRGAEQLLTLLGAPALSLLTLAVFRGYRALALASGLTVLAYAVDVIAGSPLTTLSVLGPDPALGVRFYGIGNELEALLAVLVLGGTGAALAGFAPNLSSRRTAAAFLASGLGFAFVFAAGRFGADVGAAIVLALGSAAAAATLVARRRRAALLVLAAPLAAVGLLAAVDLLSGANAHLTRSVLDAGGLNTLGDVAQRRLQLSGQSFTRPIVLAFLPLVLAAGVWAIVRREALAAWLGDVPAVRAGLIGALAGTFTAALVNDSGGILLEVGAACLLAFVAFAWAEAADPAPRYS